ncbi:DNRLRE domain-containing protein [Pontiellaceae bacterium B1224]|nr:DNRLRE domain-containing protein [Pontiellaceae bacterium B1224]
MKTTKYGQTLASACILLAFSAASLTARASEYSNPQGGDWEVPGNWDTGTVPSGSDTITIAGSAGGQTVVMDADSWTFMNNNSLNYSTTEYRTGTFLLAGAETASLNIDIGSGNTWKTTSAGAYFIGDASGSDGTLNIRSGNCIFEASLMHIAKSVGSTGRINITGANASYTAGRESGGTSLSVGTGGDGTFYISDGTFQSRAGVTVASAGIFEVAGSAADEIGIGSYSSLDGNWQQDAGGILKISIDSGGITPLFIDDQNNDGSGGDVTFDSGALLDVGFQGSEENGVWSIMHWEGTLTDNGLDFAPGVNTDLWSMNWVDTDSSNGVDTLRVTYSSPFYTTNGTPYSWLQQYYPELSSAEEFQLADNSDTDADGLLTREEYIAGTIPTNAASVFTMNAPSIAGSTMTLSWSSVAGKRYGVVESADINAPGWNTIASGIVGLVSETSITISVSGGSNAYFQTYIEAMPDLLELEAVSDSYVRDGLYADTNYGTVTELKTINTDDSQMELFLRFDLPSTIETPDSAFIWINTTANATDPVENAAFVVEDSSWTENGLTWNTKPVVGNELDAWVTTNSQSIKIDVLDEVTDALKNGGAFSIMIQSPHNIGLDGMSTYASREHVSVSVPKLEIKFNQPTVTVQPGESIQTALNTIHAQGGGHVILAEGNHAVSESLVMYSDITLKGQGIGISKILLDAESNEPVMIATSEGSVNSDITIKNLTIDGQQPADEQTLPGDTDRNTVRGDTYGILFTDQLSGNTFERLRIEEVEITRCAMGIHVKGVNDLRIQNSDIHGNGCLIGYDHNIYFRRAENTLLKNLNISDCTAGNGFNLSTDCYNVILDNLDASDNHFRGIRFEANDGGRRMMIINCKTNRNGLNEDQPGIRVANVPDFTIIGSTANDNGNDGFYCVNSSDGLLKDNSASGNGDQNYQIQNCTYEQSNNSGW